MPVDDLLDVIQKCEVLLSLQVSNIVNNVRTGVKCALSSLHLALSMEDV
jgi:hypothetical protein